MAKAKAKEPEQEVEILKDEEFFATNGELVNNRYDIMILVEAINSNPSGDPGNGGKPRIDHNGRGEWENTSLIYKIKTRIEILAEQKGWKGFNRLVKKGSIISEGLKQFSKYGSDINLQQRKVVDTFFDIRMFGGMLRTKDGKSSTPEDKTSEIKKEDSGKKTVEKGGQGCGTLTGSIHFCKGVSIDPVIVKTTRITRVCASNPERLRGIRKEDYTEMGENSVVHYGLYQFKGSIDPIQSQKSFFTKKDCKIFFRSCASFTKHDASSIRGELNIRRVIIWKHDSILGSTPKNQNFNRLKIALKDGIDSPEKYEDYNIALDLENLSPHLSVIDINDKEIAEAWDDETLDFDKNFM